MKEETHGEIQTLNWTFINQHKNVHPVLCVMDRTGQRTYDIHFSRKMLLLLTFVLDNDVVSDI